MLIEEVTAERIIRAIGKTPEQTGRMEYYKKLIGRRIPRRHIVKVPVVFFGKKPYVTTENFESPFPDHKSLIYDDFSFFPCKNEYPDGKQSDIENADGEDSNGKNSNGKNADGKLTRRKNTHTEIPCRKKAFDKLSCSENIVTRKV